MTSRHNHRRRWFLVAPAAAVALAAACSGEAVDMGEGDGEVAGTLVVAISSEPDNLDVHVSTASPTFLVMENVYDTLVEPAPDLSFQPALATDWEVSDDLLTWTFSLREDVTWHNDREFTADDVVASFERIMDGEIAANAWRFTSVDEVRATDDYTVEFVLNTPTPNLLANIGGFKGMAIVPPELIESDGLDTEAIGTGPFKFVSYTPGDRIVLEANPNYWGDGPYVERVEFRFMSESTTALTNLQTGEVHVTNNVPPQEIERLRNDDEVVLGTGGSNDYWYFTCNFDREPFDNIDVRRALSFAIDREQVAQAAFFDAAEATQSAMPQGNFWATGHAPFSYDPEGAEQLLADAGVEDLTVDLMLTDEFPHTIQAAQVIASQWGDIGVDVEIRTLDFGSWLDEQGEGNFDCFLLGWLNNLDGEYAYYAQHHSEGGFNFHGYANDEVDRLLDEARVTVDENARRDLYLDAATMIIDEVSYAYLYIPETVLAQRPEVDGLEIHPDGKLRLRGVRLDG
jgi:peptide/nickel transport system substrate-binding protein